MSTTNHQPDAPLPTSSPTPAVPPGRDGEAVASRRRRTARSTSVNVGAPADGAAGGMGAWQLLAAHGSTAVVAADGSGRVRSWSRSAEALLGYTPAEMIGKPLSRLLPARLRRKHRLLAGSEPDTDADQPAVETLVLPLVHRRGYELRVELELVAAGAGPTRTIAVLLRDVSQRDEAFRRLQDEDQLRRFHADHMPLARIVRDPLGRVTDWNEAAERMFGFPAEQALGQRVVDLFVPLEGSAAADQLWQRLQGGEIVNHHVEENVRRDGRSVTCAWFHTPLYDERERQRGVASLAVNVTERAASESQLRNAQKLESLGVLASGVAHDFNSLLTVIIANTALLRSAVALPPRSGEYLELIEQASFRASELVQHLMTYARTGRHNPQPTHVSRVVRDILPFAQKSVGPSHPLRSQLADELPLVEADHSQIEQILLNLCLNSQQAMPDGGEIVVATGAAHLTAAEARVAVPPGATPGRYVEISVTDTGCGMEPEMIARMFDPFFTTKPAGHGLGMASVLGILRQHEGAAVVTSQPGVGTRIRVLLPVRNDAQR